MMRQASSIGSLIFYDVLGNSQRLVRSTMNRGGQPGTELTGAGLRLVIHGR